MKKISTTRSDRNGQYRISLPAGENVLHFSADGKEELDLRVIVHSDGALNVMMTDKVTMLKEAVVSAESMAQHVCRTAHADSTSPVLWSG